MEIIFKRDDRSITLSEVVAILNAKRTAFHNKQNNVGQPDILVAEIGTKYIRLVSKRNADEKHGSAYAFLDRDGNIYKAAGWKGPAKGIRGSVFQPDCGWGKALGPYGAAYLR